jgi:hypothetical protein
MAKPLVFLTLFLKSLSLPPLASVEQVHPLPTLPDQFSGYQGPPLRTLHTWHCSGGLCPLGERMGTQGAPAQKITRHSDLCLPTLLHHQS